MPPQRTPASQVHAQPQQHKHDVATVQPHVLAQQSRMKAQAVKLGTAVAQQREGHAAVVLRDDVGKPSHHVVNGKAVDIVEQNADRLKVNDGGKVGWGHRHNFKDICIEATSVCVGQKIEADYKDTGSWFFGVVNVVRPNGNVDIKYDDGDKEEDVEMHRVRLVEALQRADSQLQPQSQQPQFLPEAYAQPQATFVVGQRVECRDGTKPWEPGVVCSLDPVKVKKDTGDIAFTWDEVRQAPAPLAAAAAIAPASAPVEAPAPAAAAAVVAPASAPVASVPAEIPALAPGSAVAEATGGPGGGGYSAPPPVDAKPKRKPTMLTAQERREASMLSELYAILRTTERLEMAFVKGACSNEDYERHCVQILAQFKTLQAGLRERCPDIKAFIREQGLQCPLAEERLLGTGVAATALIGATSGAGKESLACFSASEGFVTLSDALKLNLTAVDELLPLVRDLQAALVSIPNLPQLPKLDRIAEWLATLNNMRASDTVNEEQCRQLAMDVEQAYVQLKNWLQEKK